MSALTETSQNFIDCLKETGNYIRTHQKRENPRNGQVKHEVLVALSGGSDSTALLLGLKQIAAEFNLKVIACHVNHKLRGPESEADAQFCQELSAHLDIECKIIDLDIAKDTGKNTGQKIHYSEDYLRQKRYAALDNFAQERNISFLLTAHTLDDTVETMLFRLFRGTALTGLRGIESARRLNNNLYLLRPLLKLSKAQCLQFLQEYNVQAQQDSSNYNEIFSRNYIRHSVLPVILKRFPDLFSHLESLRQIIVAEDDLLSNLATTLFQKIESIDANNWPLDIFNAEPLALRRRILVLALQGRDIEVSFQRLEEVISICIANTTTPAYLNLNQYWRLKRETNKLSWQKIVLDNISFRFDPVEVKIPGVNPFPALDLVLLIEDYKDQELRSFPPSTANSVLVDLSRIKPPLVIRLRQPGDHIKPLGMPHSVKLKKYIHTHKKNRQNNDQALGTILLADQEEVLWLPGMGLSEKIKVIGKPSHSLNWLPLTDSTLAIC